MFIGHFFFGVCCSRVCLSYFWNVHLLALKSPLAWRRLGLYETHVFPSPLSFNLVCVFDTPSWGSRCVWSFSVEGEPRCGRHGSGNQRVLVSISTCPSPWKAASCQAARHPSAPPPGPRRGNQVWFLPSDSFDWFLGFTVIGPHSLYLVFDFFDVHSSVSTVHSFLLLSNIPLYEYAKIGFYLFPCWLYSKFEL